MKNPHNLFNLTRKFGDIILCEFCRAYSTQFLQNQVRIVKMFPLRLVVTNEQVIIAIRNHSHPTYMRSLETKIIIFI